MAAVVVDVEARRELVESHDFFERERSGYGILFLNAVERELNLRSHYPKIGKRIRGRIRRRTIVGWSHSIIYAESADLVRVLAFAHDSRRPGYWRKRLR